MGPVIQQVDTRSGMNCHLPARWLEPIRPTAHSSNAYRALFRTFCEADWASADATLADLEQWPHSLRALVRLMFSSDSPQCLSWGDKLVGIYNVAYWQHVSMNRSPLVMGVPLGQAWPHVVEDVHNPIEAVQGVMRTGLPSSSPETLFFLDSRRCAALEETFLSHKAAAVYDDDCRLAGVFSDYHISTERVLEQRRSESLRLLVETTHNLSTLTALTTKLQHALSTASLDLPISAVFLKSSVRQRLTTDLSSAHETEGALYELFVLNGMRTDGLQKTIDLDSLALTEASQVPLFTAMAWKCNQIKGPYEFEDARLGKYCSRKTYNQTCARARICPIYANDHVRSGISEPVAFVILGFSPCRPLDDCMSSYATTIENLLSVAFQNLQAISRSREQSDEARAIGAIGERYLGIVNHSPIGIALQNRETQDLIFVNPRFRTILGFTPDMDLNSWPSLIYEDDLEQLYKIASTFDHSQEFEMCEVRLRRLHTNGKPAWIAFSCSIHTNQLDDGQFHSFLTTAVADVSEQAYAKIDQMSTALETERLKDAEKMQEARANEADRAKARQLDYIDALAHEIRNPISAIGQSVDMLLEKLQGLKALNNKQDLDVQEAIAHAETIEICTGHMRSVINDALNVSKLEHGSLAVEIQECDLMEQVECVARMLELDMQKKDIQFSLVIDKSWSDHVGTTLTDPLRYKQILLNLMTNAIKFTAIQVHRRITIHLSSEHDHNQLEHRILKCAVSDSGKGMTPETVSRLFGKFYQVESTRTHIEYGGSGLGLFISQRLATLLNGRIDVESEIGAGSTITFSISAVVPTESRLAKSATSSPDSIPKKRELTDGDERSSKHVPETFTSPLQVRPVLAKKPWLSTDSITRSPITQSGFQNVARISTVLVVEDNLINQRLLVRQLQSTGYNVLVGNHGLEAVAHFKAGTKIDLVITDIEMPLMSGLETLKAVHAMGLSEVPPFIACSAYAREEQKQTFLDAGMSGVVAKPFKFPELKRKIEEVWNMNHPNVFAY